jgi:hypothetical protein
MRKLQHKRTNNPYQNTECGLRVPSSFLTNDNSQVTCKKCLKIIERDKPTWNQVIQELGGLNNQEAQ